MANPDHVRILQGGVDEWNQWRKINPSIRPDLTESSDFVGKDLRGVNLTLASLSKIHLDSANLTDADFKASDLVEASLDSAILTNADFRRTNLQRANLNGVVAHRTNFDRSNMREITMRSQSLEYSLITVSDLTNANLHWSTLNNSNFAHSNLTGVDLVGAKLISANMHNTKLKSTLLIESDLTDADLSMSDMEGSDIKYANITRTDLRTAKGFLLDSNFAKNTRFPDSARDRWSILRHTYTGSRMAFTLLFLIAFILPYVLKIIFWSAINRAQALATGVEFATPYAGNGATPCFSPTCVAEPVWKLALGFEQGVLFVSLAVLLITYNFAKAVLTFFLAPMRDQEERTYYTPAWSGLKWWQGYRFFYRIHLVVKILFYVSIATFTYNAYIWLTKTIWIPN